MGLNMNENWFEIVEILRNTLDSNYSKAEFVSAVENCFRVLGWRKTNGSLIKIIIYLMALMLILYCLKLMEKMCNPIIFLFYPVWRISV